MLSSHVTQEGREAAQFCLVLVVVHDSLLAADSLAGRLRDGERSVGQGCLQAGSRNEQEVVFFLPVFVPMAAYFLWEGSCVLCGKGKIVTRNGKEQGNEAEGASE